MLAKKQCRGSGMFILDPESQILIFFHPGSRIQHQQKFYKIVNYLNVPTHCKSGSHKNGIRKSSRKTYDHIMDIYRFEADTFIIKKEIIVSFFK